METNINLKQLFTEKVLDDICQNMNFQKIMDEIKINRVFAKYSENIKSLNLSRDSDSAKNKSILCDLIKNEQEFKELIHILLHTQHDEIALKLDPNTRDLCDLSLCDPRFGYKPQFSFGDANPPDILIRPCEERSLSSVGGIHTMSNSPRGYCVLINNYFTFGTHKEMQRFRNIFNQLHFDVIMKKNLQKKDILNLMEEISNSSELSKHNAFIFMIITHGNDNKEILDSNNQWIKIGDLINLFDNKNCPHLREKPRLFFFNCCRGKGEENSDYSTLAKRTPLKTTPVNVPLPRATDILVCYSTPEGNLAYVDWDTGTKFGSALADSLVAKSWYKDINSIIIKANNNLKELKSPKTPIEWTQTLTKQLYFQPLEPHIVKHPLKVEENDSNPSLDSI